MLKRVAFLSFEARLRGASALHSHCFPSGGPPTRDTRSTAGQGKLRESSSGATECSRGQTAEGGRHGFRKCSQHEEGKAVGGAPDVGPSAKS